MPCIAFTCCRFCRTWPNPTQDCRPPRPSVIAWWMASLAFISLMTNFCWSLVLSQVQTYGVLFFLEFPWGIFGMGCSWPLLKENCTRQYLCSCPPGTGTKIQYMVRPQTVHIFNAHLFTVPCFQKCIIFLCRHLTPNNIKVSLKLNLYKWWRGYRGELKKHYLA